jgi:hypothetical protein
MAVRLGFAVASCMNPDILLVDEVLAVGDASFRSKCIERIRQLHSRGTSLIFVSHDLGLVKAICDTAILLENGMIRAKGSPGEVIDRYNETLEARRALKMTRGGPQGEENGPDVEITGIEVLARGEAFAGGDIRSDRPVEIRVSYVSYREMGRASALVRIYRSDGLSCCVVRTNEDGFDFTIAPGKGVIAVLFDPLQLSGGMYHAVAWILDEAGVNGIARGESDWFRVANAVPGREVQESVFEPRRRWARPYGEAGESAGGSSGKS